MKVEESKAGDLLVLFWFFLAKGFPVVNQPWKKRASLAHTELSDLPGLLPADHVKGCQNYQQYLW